MKGLLGAWVLLLVSGTAAALAYARIIDEERPESALIGSIPNGKHRYQLLSQGKVVADIVSSMEYRDEQYIYEGEGTIGLRFLAKKITPSIFVRANFNTIGQLGGLVIRIRGEGIYANMGGVNVDPIQVRMRVNLQGGEPFQYATTIPGPVLIKQNRDETYRIEYLNFGKVTTQMSALASHPALQNTKLSLRECPSVERCPEGARADLDLTPFLVPLLGSAHAAL